jgi:hypothetical protein
MGVEIQIQALSTSALDTGEWYAVMIYNIPRHPHPQHQLSALKLATL